MNTQLKFLIVEDDLNAALDLQMMLEEMGYTVQGRVDNSAKAMEVIFTKKPDVILMDIDIKGQMTGTEIGQHIKHLNIPIIFTTGFDNIKHYKDAQKTNMYGYIIKPVNQFTLQANIESLIKSKTADDFKFNELKEEVVLAKTIFLKKKSTYHKIDFSDVQCIEADGKYALLYVGDDKYISKYSLSEMEKIIPQNKFMRIHRSYIINMDYLVAFAPSMNSVRIKQGKELPISRSYKDAFMTKINIG